MIIFGFFSFSRCSVLHGNGLPHYPHRTDELYSLAVGLCASQRRCWYVRASIFRNYGGNGRWLVSFIAWWTVTVAFARLPPSCHVLRRSGFGTRDRRQTINPGIALLPDDGASLFSGTTHTVLHADPRPCLRIDFLLVVVSFGVERENGLQHCLYCCCLSSLLRCTLCNDHSLPPVTVSAFATVFRSCRVHCSSVPGFYKRTFTATFFLLYLGLAAVYSAAFALPAAAPLRWRYTVNLYFV